MEADASHNVPTATGSELPGLPAQAPQALNHLKTGIYARCPLSHLPAPFSAVKKHTHQFRAALERAVADRHGSVTPRAAKVIRTACLAFRQARCVERIFALNPGLPGTPGSLSHETWLAYSDRLVRYEQQADACLRELGLPLQRGSRVIDLSAMLDADRPPAGQPDALP